MGLYSVKQIVEAHDGRIEVYSEPGHGAMFEVRLPLIRTVDAVA
jgi:signal transduction histidine kinase